MSAPEQTEAEPVRKPPAQWAIEHGVSIHDPDGWRRPGSPPFDEPTTEDDFLDRLSTSTAIQLPGFWDAIDAAGRELLSLPYLDTSKLAPVDVRAAAYAAVKLVIPVVTQPLFYRLDTAAERERRTKATEAEGYERHRLALREALAEHASTDKSLIAHIGEDVPQLVNLVRVLRKATGGRHPDAGGMSMGEAVDALRQGERVTRAAWLYLGTGPYLFLVPGSQFAVGADRPLGMADPRMVGRSVNYAEHIDQVHDGVNVGVWTPTTEDVLATDWRVPTRPSDDDQPKPEENAGG